MCYFVKISSQEINGEHHRRDFSHEPGFSKAVRNLKQKRTIIPSRYLFAFCNFQVCNLQFCQVFNLNHLKKLMIFERAFPSQVPLGILNLM